MSNVPTILVVDDTDVAREPLVRLHKAEGFMSVGAGNGRKAWDLMPMHRVDLVLLDILMPVMNGLEFLGLLRSDHRFAHLPVVVLTAVSDDSWKKDIRALGVQGFYGKPASPSTN